MTTLADPPSAAPGTATPGTATPGTATETATDAATDPLAKPRLDKSATVEYRRPSTAASLFQLVTTLVLWSAMWVAMWWSMTLVGYWLTLILAIPTAFLTVRIFILQHDCGHGSFFKSQTWNHLVGAVLGVLVVTPYLCWRRQHATHHAHSGNLDYRGIGDIDTATIAEYKAMTPWQRFKYRAYRHPLVLFGIGPIIQFGIFQRFTFSLPKDWKRERQSVYLTNLAIAAIATSIIIFFDWRAFVLLYLPVMTLAASIGVWLFYVQHQFNPTYWDHDENWNYNVAAVDGSSFYDLPKFFHWLTANIGYHHIHHLDSRIPNYRLPQVYSDLPQFQKNDRLTFWQSLTCANLKLWDEATRRLVSFKQARQIMHGA